MTIGLEQSTQDFQKFHDLMSFRIYNILMVSSLYDSFILEKDGLLQEQLMLEYRHHNIQYAPRIRQVMAGEKAMEMLKKMRFDAIITGTKLYDAHIGEFIVEAKNSYPDLPIIMLAHVTDELSKIQSTKYFEKIDNLFVWTGDTSLLFAIAKYLEDRENVERDTKGANVRVIIVVEDSPRYYSAFLPIIYSEILRQNAELIDEGLNVVDKVIRMRTRPKILLAKNYKEAMALFNKYKEYILGVISDIKFPLDETNGELNDEAGFILAKKIKQENAHIPVILQSAESDNIDMAHQKGAHFINKNSSTMLLDLRNYLLEYFGFGDFIFRTSDGEEVARAANVKQLETRIKTIPEECLVMHAGHDDFSHWLFARGEFDLANEIKPVNVNDFNSYKELRKYLTDTIKKTRKEKAFSFISDFNVKTFDESFAFVKIGFGSMGGKARGLAFINSLISSGILRREYLGVPILVPKSLVIASTEFERFIAENNLFEEAMRLRDDDQIKRLFLRAKLSGDLRAKLGVFINQVTMPLAIRSSSLFEDSQDQPFAGIYETIMLPNNQKQESERLGQLEAAIKMIFASTYMQEAKQYFESSSFRTEEERMSVIVQELIGKRYDRYYYPNLSGVAQSFNYYPIGHLTPEDGIAHVVLGFGKTVVDGGLVFSFCPKYPTISLHPTTPAGFVKSSQKQFYVMDLEKYEDEGNISNSEKTFPLLDLQVAEGNGTLKAVGGTYSHEDNRIHDGIFRDGIRVVNFSNILKNDLFPLAEILSYVLDVGERAFAGPVEIEFAVNLRSDPQDQQQRDEFYLLQIRPYLAKLGQEDINIGEVEESRILIRSSKTMGNRRINEIDSIVYVVPEKFDRTETKKIAAEIARINNQMKDQGRKYVLIGMGRWGTSDRFLGIPVNWAEISSAEVFVECSLEDFHVDPSFGTHFFHNLTAGKAGYLSVDQLKTEDHIDFEWLNAQPAEYEGKYIRLVRLKKPLEIIIDGHHSKAIVLKPSCLSI